MCHNHNSICPGLLANMQPALLAATCSSEVPRETPNNAILNENPMSADTGMQRSPQSQHTADVNTHQRHLGIPVARDDAHLEAEDDGERSLSPRSHSVSMVSMSSYYGGAP